MKQIVFMILVILCFSHPCHAVDSIDTIYPESEIGQAKEILPDEIQGSIENYNIKDGRGLQESIMKLKDHFHSHLEETLDSLWTPALSILIVIIMCSIMEPMFQGKILPLRLFGGVEILCVTLSDSQAFFSEAVSAIHSLYDFSTVLLPCLAGTSVAAGASISAGVKYTAAAFFMNMLLNFSNTFLIPIISIYLISVIGSCVFEQKLLSAIADFIRWSCKMLLTGTTVIFTAYLNIAGLITGTSDMFAIRLTKTAINGVLPVVGSIISNAASSLVAGAAMLRNSIGVFGLLSIIGLLIMPFVHLLLRYLLFVAVSRLAIFFPSKHFSELLGGISGAFGMMLGVIGVGFIMIFLTLISFMQIVGG